MLGSALRLIGGNCVTEDKVCALGRGGSALMDSREVVGGLGNGSVGGLVGLDRLKGDTAAAPLFSGLKGMAGKLLRFSIGDNEVELVRVRSESSTRSSKGLTIVSR